MPTRVALLTEDQHLGEREGVGMRNRQERGRRVHGGETPGGAAVEQQRRRTAVADHLDIPPEDPLRVACPERLHRGLLGGEATRKVDGRDSPTRAVGDLSVREDPAQKPIAEPLHGTDDARNVGGVYSETDDV